MLRLSVQRLSTTTLRKTSVKSVAAYTTSLQPSSKPVGVDIQQAENRATTWSKSQRSKADAFSGPRFEQTDLSAQVMSSLFFYRWNFRQIDMTFFFSVA